MNSRRKFLCAAAVMALIAGATAASVLAKVSRHGRADLGGFTENPTLSSPASGSLDLTIAPDDSSLTYTLRYRGFPTNVQQAHIHLGAPWFNGGIMVFFCTNLTPPTGPPTPPPCPTVSGTVKGTLTAADVVGPTTQGVSAGEFGKVLAALRAGAAYGNVHTMQYPGGEIRGQVLFEDSGRDDR
jgi:hypothetical protein